MVIGKFAGELALAGLTISFPIMMLTFSFAWLVGVGAASLISIKLGEKDKAGANLLSRVKKALAIAMGAAAVFSTVLFVIIQVFPEIFIQLLISTESSTIPVSVNGLRLYMKMIPVVAINLLGTAYYQSVANGKVALFLSIARQVIFLIPAILFLPNLLGLNGVWLSTPLSDGLSVVITMLFLIPVFTKNKVVNELELETN